MNSALANKPQIGPYKIIRAIGSGGMGEVYLASEERLGRNVALKVITPELANNASTLRRFETEGRTLAMINHKNVVSVYAIDYIDGFHFIAMEYIEGRSLSSLLRNLAFPANEAAALFTQLADGLAALHDKNVIHRDLKPHNIIFQKDSVVKIIDLGIAKSFNDTNISATTAGMMVGTIQYLAPEITLGRQATALS
ncbi:MAG: serine/threonine-protein kinase, partial [Bdellovibrionales bacterium]